jgi:hypothetical protein
MIQLTKILCNRVFEMLVKCVFCELVQRSVLKFLKYLFSWLIKQLISWLYTHSLDKLVS